MSTANSLIIEGRVGRGLVHYPPRDGKREFLSFEIIRGKGETVLIQAYDEIAVKALADGVSEGKWVFVRGALRMSKVKARCGHYHRFHNVVAAVIELRESDPRTFSDAESLGEPPEVF